MHERETTTSPERSVLGRRTILKGAAWSVPAVLAVGATPAFASSTSKVDVTTMDVGVERKVHTFTLTVYNPNSIAVNIDGLTYTTPTGQNNPWKSLTTTAGIPQTLGGQTVSSTITIVATRKDEGAGFPSFAFMLSDSRGESYDVSVNVTDISGDGSVTFTDS